MDFFISGNLLVGSQMYRVLVLFNFQEYIFVFKFIQCVTHSMKKNEFNVCILYRS